jgi:hypothetical protein
MDVSGNKINPGTAYSCATAAASRANNAAAYRSKNSSTWSLMSVML